MSAGKPVKTVLEEGDISRALTRIAHEIIKKIAVLKIYFYLEFQLAGLFLRRGWQKLLAQ